MASDTATLVRRARKQGWTSKVDRGGHIALTNPEGDTVHIGSTPRGREGWNKTLMKVRHAGLSVPRAGMSQNDDSDQGRGERMARHAADGTSFTQRILEELQSTPRKKRDAHGIAEATGLMATQVSPALAWLVRKHPEVHRSERGVYFWSPEIPTTLLPSTEMAQRSAAMETEIAPGEKVYCSCGKRFRTVGHYRDHLRPMDDASHHVLSSTLPSKRDMERTLRYPVQKIIDAPDLPLNGNGNRGSSHEVEVAVASLQEVADASIMVATRADHEVINVVPSALPSDLPAIFEAVTTDGAGRLILRDELGNIWMAVPMKPVL